MQQSKAMTREEPCSAVAARFLDGDARGADEKGIRYGRHVL